MIVLLFTRVGDNNCLAFWYTNCIVQDSAMLGCKPNLPAFCLQCYKGLLC